MDKHRHHQQLSLAKSSRQRCNEWIFRDVPSDITVEVNGGTFALHKFPLASRSRRIRNLVAEHRDSDISKVELMNLPGGVSRLSWLLPVRVQQFRVIIEMKCRGVCPERIGASLVNYTQKELTKRVDSGSTSYEKLVVETIISLLPTEKLAVPVSFLFGLLRSAVMLDCSIACRLDLERRIGSQLEIATLDDLLIPSFRHGCETLFDVDTVHRILVNFSQQDDCVDDMDDVSIFESGSPHFPSQSALLKVSKLVDNYLAEIAPDANVKLAQFMAIAEALPAHARTIHDGLYRAIDTYLKGILEADKKKLCKLIDFQKLSQEAGAHAVQNERLPL